MAMSKFSRWRKKPVILFILLLFTSVLVYILIYAATKENVDTIRDNKKDINIKLDPEIAQILRDTPYLWRKFNLTENDTALHRVQAQQRWVKELSKSKYLSEQKKKVMWLEAHASLFYWTEGRVQCPYAPKFEEKCELKKMSFLRRMLGPYFKFIGISGDALISVRNWESYGTYKIPGNMVQIMQILEPPNIAKDANLGLNNAVLASYWRGSDIPTPYFLSIPNNSSEFKPPPSEAVAKLASKTKMVAAIVSNCDSSDRLEYIRELQKFVGVDVFGKCGTFSCPKSENDACLRKIEAEYKFFLSFENSRCEDYITEKLFDNVLQWYIVPIVRGGRPSDYSSAAPTNSFIHVDSFPSPEKLASHLKFLDKNDDAYLKYFEYKGSSYISLEHFQDFFCRACAMLFYRDFVPNPVWSSPDIEWKDVNHCLLPDEARWNNV
ncbi:alpha-(1,3)-fucosyltransferase 10-like isoform X2 [Folsomia candida]|nr:alpha-(1,3)-fucosyltransferase 10-like isoform X2 [Folsomia candida]